MSNKEDNIAYYEGHFLEDQAIIFLLKKGCLFSYIDKNVLSLSVLCNDVFAWGCADSEEISSYSELEDLYNEVIKHDALGSIKWVCLKRNEKPQRPIESSLRKEGVWDDRMENLKENSYELYLGQNMDLFYTEEK